MILPADRTTTVSWYAIAVLAGVLAAPGCTSQPVEVRDNAALRQTIHESVPESWRAAAASIETVSPLIVSPELSAFAHGAVNTNDPGRDRMLDLIDALMDEDGVGFTYDRDATLTAAEAFEARVGNCMGFSNLLIAAAREIGLSAKYELVSHRLRWDKVEDVLVGTLHVRVVSLVSGRRMVFDFYPLPVESGFTAKPLTDSEALAHHVNNMAADALHAGDDSRAYGLLYTALDTAPHIAFIWSNLGLLLSRHDLDAAAEAAYREALAIAPDGLNALSNLQRLYIRQGRDAEAGALQAQLEKYRYANPYYHAWLGEQAQASSDHAQAIEHFQQAVSRKKTEPDFYLKLADSYTALGMDSAASRSLRKAESIETPRKVSRRVRRELP